MDFAANTLLTSAVYRVLHAQGFTRSGSGAVGVLTDLLARYLTLLTTSASNYAMLCGRGGTLDIRDLVESLDEMGVSIDDLSTYCAGEAIDFMYLVSRRREEDLLEMRSTLHSGLEREESQPLQLEWRELPEDFEFDIENDLEDIEPPFSSMLIDDQSSLHPITHSHPEHIPSFLPPFPVVTGPDQEDPEASLMPPPLIPGTNMPTLPSQTLTSTSTSAQDYLIRNQYELSSLSATPEWHLPPDTIPSTTTSKALQIPKQQRPQPANVPQLATPHPMETLLKAYHHILTHPGPPASELGPPSHAKHRLLLQFLFPSLSGTAYTGSLTDKWDAPDTLYGTLGSNIPRPPGGIGGSAVVGGSMPYPLHQDPSRDLVPKNEKGQPDDRVITHFPPLGGRHVGGLGIGSGGDRTVGLVGHNIGISRLSELGRALLNNQIRARINKLNHPTPLYRPVRDGMQRLVYGRGNEAPWNSTFFPMPASSSKDKGKEKSGSSSNKGLGKIKISLNGMSDAKKRKKRKGDSSGANDDDDEGDEGYKSSDSESGGATKKKAKLEGLANGGGLDDGRKFQDARLWLTWEHDVKDFRTPLAVVARGVSAAGAGTASSSTGPASSGGGSGITFSMAGSTAGGGSGGRGPSLQIAGRRISMSGPKA